MSMLPDSNYRYARFTASRPLMRRIPLTFTDYREMVKADAPLCAARCPPPASFRAQRGATHARSDATTPSARAWKVAIFSQYLIRQIPESPRSPHMIFDATATMPYFILCSQPATSHWQTTPSSHAIPKMHHRRIPAAYHVHIFFFACRCALLAQRLSHARGDIMRAPLA